MLVAAREEESVAVAVQRDGGGDVRDNVRAVGEDLGQLRSIAVRVRVACGAEADAEVGRVHEGVEDEGRHGRIPDDVGAQDERVDHGVRPEVAEKPQRQRPQDRAAGTQEGEDEEGKNEDQRVGAGSNFYDPEVGATEDSKSTKKTKGNNDIGN